MTKKYSLQLQQTDRTQYIIGFLFLLIYAGCLFFPLMDKDAAHHANIALRMLQYDDYVSLVDRQTDYLDKPHFLFWSSALSFKLFGVNTFAHRLPAILFALLSIYSTYRLTRLLTDKTTAKLAAIMLASAQGFILSINDARMETPLTAGIIFGLWQLIAYINSQRLLHLAGASLGAAMAFSTKGWIGVVIIFIAAFLYMLLQRKWKVLTIPKTYLFLMFFGLFISPVLYAYYLQFDQHPEKVIRNMTNISGVKFILWDQNFERFGGDNFIKGGRNSSVFFLYHTFLWAYFPWCIIAYAGLLLWLKRMIAYGKWRHPVNFAALAFAFILFTISFSKFKMPHYIFWLLPLATIFTAPYLRMLLARRRSRRLLIMVHTALAVLVLLATLIMNFYFFQPPTLIAWVIGIALIVCYIYYLLAKRSSSALRFLGVTLGMMIVFNFFANYSFFPNLLKYQGGNELVAQMKRDGIQVKDEDIILVDHNAHTFDFYRGYNHDVLEYDRVAQTYDSTRGKYFVLTGGMIRGLREQGFEVIPVASHVDYNVTTLKLKFLNPATRASKLDTIMLAKLRR